jgi:large subunit ribosomal protein L30
VSQKIRVKQTRSLIGQPEKVRRVVKGLGLRRVGMEKMHTDNNCIRGMVNKVRHLVCYELVKGE